MCVCVYYEKLEFIPFVDKLTQGINLKTNILNYKLEQERIISLKTLSGPREAVTSSKVNKGGDAFFKKNVEVNNFFFLWENTTMLGSETSL